MLPPSTTPPARSRFWDIVRGIGILSIVMGHCFGKAVIYVYTYHLAIFFFVSGFLYSEKKYADDPFGHFAAKLKSSWPKYTFYMSLLTLLHNPFQNLNINPLADNYTFSQTMTQLANALIFNGMEVLGGALWFVPTWLIACGIFGGTVWFAFRFFPGNQEKNPGVIRIRALIVAVVSLLFTLYGAFLMSDGIYLFYRVHLVLFIQIFFAAGWVMKTCLPRFKSLLKWYVGILCVLVWGIVINVYQPYFDLASSQVGNEWQYFFLAFLGIYGCLVLASVLEKTEKIGRIFAFWGKHSFDIMALHFLIFKLVDACYGRIFHYPPEYYSAFPQAFGNILWPVYTILGTTLPALLDSKLEKIRKRKRELS